MLGHQIALYIKLFIGIIIKLGSRHRLVGVAYKYTPNRAVK
jgi:hypothetical protein